MQPLAVSVELCPKVIVVGEALTVGAVGIGFTVIVTTSLESELQPLIVQTTLYDFVAVGLTVMLVPANPPVHANAPPLHALAVKVVELPLQIVALVAVIVGFVGKGFIVIVAALLESEVQLLIVQATL